VRLAWGDRLGPIREIHAGSGYLGQDSATVVMAGPTPPSSVQVRWPGGRTTISVIPANAREVVIDPNGALRVVR
jgi:hypothetical protein